MSSHIIPLDQAELDRTVTVIRVDPAPVLRQRLIDLGLVPGSKITPLVRSSFHDPVAYRIRNTTLALRNRDAACILVETGEDHE